MATLTAVKKKNYKQLDKASVKTIKNKLICVAERNGRDYKKFCYEFFAYKTIIKLINKTWNNKQTYIKA